MRLQVVLQTVAPINFPYYTVLYPQRIKATKSTIRRAYKETLLTNPVQVGTRTYSIRTLLVLVPDVELERDCSTELCERERV